MQVRANLLHLWHVLRTRFALINVNILKSEREYMPYQGILALHVCYYVYNLDQEQCTLSTSLCTQLYWDEYKVLHYIILCDSENWA
jgi:hypothetical protein